ncbi:GNAT family N-acetyltransferase [Citrobacter werkmanii]|uniref:GNAT family N-acetyltransferase n=1 Tax=Citrobacter werkmanii TaxID=67827 RepID=UPI0026523D18|nr:GNAT family N-acetyltransferase [Citrobacter werkmanii]MDN8559087.1 GNAT family N-acetyltransferase [Citrobacter werkmanii]
MSTVNSSPVLKHPAACSEDELRTFQALVRANGLASAARVPESELLAFLYNNAGRLIAAGAIKNPSPGYQQRVFNTYAGLTTASESWPSHEVGFFSIAQHYQGQGLGRRILQALINEMPHAPLFATTRTPGMARLLEEQEFTVVGNHWTTAPEQEPLALYIRKV